MNHVAERDIARHPFLNMLALHISAFDVNGGAAIAAHRLHQGLRRIGAGSHMIVNSKSSGDRDVSEVLHASTSLGRIYRRLDHFRFQAERRRYAATVSPTLELFSDDRVAGLDPFASGIPDADVINLHWVAGLVDYRRFFTRLGVNKPLVWTLHDMNPFTGGCHYALGCERFTASCGACLQLGSKDENDVSRRVVARKLRSFASRRRQTTRIVAPSRWIASEARRSLLFQGFEVEVIPNGLDTDVFRPRDKETARAVFGLPPDRPVVLFAADGIKNHRKGFDLLAAALADISSETGAVLAVLGGHTPGEALPCGVVSLGRLEGGRLLSFAYSAADLFVLPTRADNLPNVVLEAMACGTPVVSFRVGGLPDLVQNGATGLLASAEDIADLRAAVLALLVDAPLRSSMSGACRETAVREFALELQARRYFELYEKLIEADRRL